MSESNPRGIKIFAWLLILASFYKMYGFIDYGYYEFMFQPLAQTIIQKRYAVSVILRAIGIITALGLLARMELFRKIFIGLAIISILGLPFKHPFSVFKNIAIYSEYQKQTNQYPQRTVILDTTYPLFPENLRDYRLTAPVIPRVSQIIFIMIDIVFALGSVYYFTRKDIKEVFTKRKGKR